jgi:hypothetical protein
MRTTFLFMPLLLAASPVSAQVAPVVPPSAADRAASTLDAITDAVLDLRIGRLKAAIDGRPASPAEQQMTIRDVESARNPGFDHQLHRQIAEARPIMRQGIAAVNDAVPEVLDGLQQVSRALERATANMPDPTYPRR